MQIIVEHTHLVISQYAHDAVNNGRVHTSTYTTIMSICTCLLGEVGKKKTIARRLLRRTFKGTNTVFLFSRSLSIYLLQYEDLVQGLV
jgi:hypothetical protein